MNISISQAEDLLRKWESERSVLIAIFRLPLASGQIGSGSVLVDSGDKVTMCSDGVDSKLRFKLSASVSRRYSDVREWKDPSEGSPVSNLSIEFDPPGSVIT